MSSVGIGRTSSRVVRPPFYLVMSLAMAAVIIAGFSRTVPDDFSAGTDFPLLLAIHGTVFTLWILLFVAQPAIVARGSLKLHRRIRGIGAGPAAAIVGMGLGAGLLRVH